MGSLPSGRAGLFGVGGGGKQLGECASSWSPPSSFSFLSAPLALPSPDVPSQAGLVLN